MLTPREKFQELLKKLFQFDCAELDFGIYRIMNQKRAVIEKFIDKDLLDGLAKQLGSSALKDEAALRREFDVVAAKIREELEETPVDALDAEGNLAPKYHASKIGKQYLSLRERLQGARSTPELEAVIFNHLYTFFSRYYDDGDFMSLRRYSKRDKYAIPYNGEEVHLHWANSDQYYIKTAENFTDYSYKHGGWTVHFKLRNADVEQNNVKGAKRFFLPRLADVALDEKAKTVTIPVEYRPLTPQEEITFKSKPQETILANAAAKITEVAKKNADALTAVLHEKRKDADGNPVSLLEHHLRVYTRKNSSDFFIHKDLKGFLERELDFYLKNEVLNLDELEAGGEARAESWFQMLRAIKAIGRTIIAFVAQIENFQKRLFEKKKFVTEVHYCVTLDRVPEELYSEIAKNKAQIAEWLKLLHIDELDGYSEKPTLQFLKRNKSLVIDTKHFGRDFEDALLQSVANLDGMCNGLLVHSDNFQGLHLLHQRYRDSVRCVYVDPPYNTSASAIPYKNDYRHSSWATMMRDRLALIRGTMKMNAAIFVSIDKAERTLLEFALDAVFRGDNRVEELIWTQNTANSQLPNYSTNHEYVEVYAKDRATAEREPNMFRELKPGCAEILELVQSLNREYAAIAQIQSQIKNLFKEHIIAFRHEVEGRGEEWNAESQKRDPWKGIYNYCRAEYRDAHGTLVPESEVRKRSAKIWIWREISPSAPASKQSSTTKDTDHHNFRYYKPLHPVTGKPCPHPSGGWKFPQTPDPASPDRVNFEDLDHDNRIVWGEDEKKVPQTKGFLHEVETNIGTSVFYDYNDGEKEVADLFGQTGLFLSPKNSRFPRRFIGQTTSKLDNVLDCFGGSGSTAHAVISLNRQDGGKRKFILMEMGDYFDTLTKPRITKCIYSDGWKDGRPTTRDGISYAYKYLRLESYEDALDNITFQPANEQAMLQLEDYALSYMLDFETKKSDTLLNIAKLDSPFDYKLRRYGKDDPLPVDLPETFNYLIGLHVESRRVYDNKGTRYLVYRGRAEGRETVVIWRTSRGWTQKEFEADRDFVAKQKLTEGAEDVLVNTDSFIKDARSLDPVFKRRMFNEE